MRLDSLALLAMTSGEMWGSLCRSVFCGGDVENKKVRRISDLNIFSCLIAKVFNLGELVTSGMARAAQNPEPAGLICKILWNKGLAAKREADFFVSGTGVVYCLWLNTEHSF